MKRQISKSLADQIVARVRAKLGPDSVRRVGQQDARPRDVISTGVDVLDWRAIGCGGLPTGSVSEIAGAEGSCKSSLAMQCMAQVQRLGGVAVLADSERSFDPERATVLGVNIDDVVLLDTDSMERVLEGIAEAARAHPRDARAPMLIVWDSLASETTMEELAAGIAPEKSRDVRASLLSRAFRQLNPAIAASRAHLMIVNQLRSTRGVAYGPTHTTPGGAAPKYAASVMLRFFGGRAVKNGTEHVGKVMTVIVQKNRFAPPFRKTEVRFDYATGWDNAWSTLNLAKDAGLIGARDHGAGALLAARVALWGDDVSKKCAPIAQCESKGDVQGDPVEDVKEET